MRQANPSRQAGRLAGRQATYSVIIETATDVAFCRREAERISVGHFSRLPLSAARLPSFPACRFPTATSTATITSGATRRANYHLTAIRSTPAGIAGGFRWTERARQVNREVKLSLSIMAGLHDLQKTSSSPGWARGSGKPDYRPRSMPVCLPTCLPAYLPASPFLSQTRPTLPSGRD